MIAEVMLYALATSVLLAIAACAAEEVLRPYRLPLRWVWLAALVGTVALPAASWATGGTWPGGTLSFGRDATPVMDWLESASAPELVEVSGATETGEGALSAGFRMMLLVGWALASVVALIGYGWTWWRVFRKRGSWRVAEVAGAPVRIAPRDGPVVIGLRRPEIVVPEWLLSEPAGIQRVVMVHEREHIRARDHALLAVAPLVALAAPWNLPVWWILRRLRLAVELDCDRRVLSQGIAALAYGSVLLDVAGRGVTHSFAAAALAEPRTFLERRILAMTSVIPARRLPRALAFGVVAALAIAVSCETAGPTNVKTVQPEPAAGAAEATATQREETRLGEYARVAAVHQNDTLAKVLSTLAGSMRAVDGVYAITLKTTDAFRDSSATNRLSQRPRSATGTRPGDPLIIVDGVVVSSSTIDQVDRDQIAHIEVLKGAEAVRLYGDRAADGVIFITTNGTGAIRTDPSATNRVIRRSPLATQMRQGDPLIIVDGIVAPSSTIDHLDPALIDHIEVVKGAAAAQLYGERAANGVILITTKER